MIQYRFKIFIELIFYCLWNCWVILLYQINAALTCLTRKLSPDPDPDSIDPTKNWDQVISTQ